MSAISYMFHGDCSNFELVHIYRCEDESVSNPFLSINILFKKYLKLQRCRFGQEQTKTLKQNGQGHGKCNANP